MLKQPTHTDYTDPLLDLATLLDNDGVTQLPSTRQKLESFRSSVMFSDMALSIGHDTDCVALIPSVLQSERHVFGYQPEDPLPDFSNTIGATLEYVQRIFIQKKQAAKISAQTDSNEQAQIARGQDALNKADDLVINNIWIAETVVRIRLLSPDVNIWLIKNGQDFEIYFVS